jgi:hypothetical protein
MNKVRSPIFFESYDHIVKPLINLINGRTRILADKLSEFSITNEEVLEAIRGLNQASQNIKNILPKKINAGQVLCISGELLHARSAFSVNKKNPRYALRLRGTSKKEYLLLENLKKTKNVSNELEYAPGV